MSLQDREVSLLPDPFWPERFDDEQQRLQKIVGDHLLGVYHVGSTAIPDVPGKPALDIIAVFETEDALDAAAAELIETQGFERPPETTIVIRWEEDYAVFVKLHTPDDVKVRSQLAFRDYLLDHPSMRVEYAEVKRDAATEHPEDLEAYTQAKGTFVASVLEDARAEGYFEELPDIA